MIKAGRGDKIFAGHEIADLVSGGETQAIWYGQITASTQCISKLNVSE